MEERCSVAQLRVGPGVACGSSVFRSVAVKVSVLRSAVSVVALRRSVNIMSTHAAMCVPCSELKCLPLKATLPPADDRSIAIHQPSEAGQATRSLARHAAARHVSLAHV